MRATLDDGTALDVRPIRASDAPLLARGLEELSPDAVVQRFLVPKRSFTTGELRSLTEVDGVDHVALVALAPGAPGTLVAVARFVRDPVLRDRAELAIVVADARRREGIGTLLVGELAALARARGIARFTATMLGTNLPARRLLRTLGEVRFVTHAGLADADVPLPAQPAGTGIAARRRPPS